MTIFILVSILLVAAFAIAMFVGVSPTSQIVKVQPNEIYRQQELMYYVYSYSAFSNIGKKGSGIVSILCQVFQDTFLLVRVLYQRRYQNSIRLRKEGKNHFIYCQLWNKDYVVSVSTISK